MNKVYELCKAYRNYAHSPSPKSSSLHNSVQFEMSRKENRRET